LKKKEKRIGEFYPHEINWCVLYRAKTIHLWLIIGEDTVAEHVGTYVVWIILHMDKIYLEFSWDTFYVSNYHVLFQNYETMLAQMKLLGRGMVADTSIAARD
jgi:hypothetical protein